MIVFNRNKFFTRFKIIILIFSICYLAAFLELLKITSLHRDFYLNQCAKIAWIQKTIPATRGNIYDKNNVALAWTERRFNLVFSNHDISQSERNQIISIINQELNITKLQEPNCLIIKQNLNPTEIQKIKPLLKKFYDKIRIESFLQRVTVDYPEIKTYIGKIPTNDSQGSGIELLYDQSLRGKDATFTVMLDRNRNWIPRSFKWIKKYEKGRDLILPYSVEEIIQKERAKTQNDKKNF